MSYTGDKYKDEIIAFILSKNVLTRKNWQAAEIGKHFCISDKEVGIIVSKFRASGPDPTIASRFAEAGYWRAGTLQEIDDTIANYDIRMAGFQTAKSGLLVSREKLILRVGGQREFL